jgi:hypothetical protein
MQQDSSKTILAKILDPLLDRDLGELQPVVGVICKMLQHSFFACLREVEDYIVCLGKVSLRDTLLLKRSNMAVYSSSRNRASRTCCSLLRVFDILELPHRTAIPAWIHALVGQPMMLIAQDMSA